MNDNYVQAAMPEGSEEGILKGSINFVPTKKPKHRFWKWSNLPEVIQASELLDENMEWQLIFGR